MEGNVARTNCHVDGKARDIEHAKKVSQQVSKVSDLHLSRRMRPLTGPYMMEVTRHLVILDSVQAKLGRY